MALAANVYRALEDVVGTENISRDPAILESYRKVWGKAFMGITNLPCPGAVVLPASTEEVQTIVRLCNKYRVKFKAISTGWIAMMSPGPDGVQVDLRRMNRILEINEKNMYAVVEPYVISGQLQAELMKRGLNFNVIGAGPNTTALAPTKVGGLGETSESTGYDNRNILAMEWVLPDGEILRTGSLGAGAGWFCGEGLGPSLRGVARGNQGANGGMGIFTRAALKLYHWPWPRIPEIEGISPHYTFKAPDTFKLHCATFPTWKKAHDAVYRIGESGIAMAMSKKGPSQLAFNMGTSNEEALALHPKIDRSLKERILWTIIITANSKKEFDYKEKVLQKILSETGGEPFTLLEGLDTASLAWRLIHASGIYRELFRVTGEITASVGGTEALLPQIEHMKSDKESVNQLTEEGAIMGRVGEDWVFGLSFEGGHYHHLEHLMPVKTTPEAQEATGRLLESSCAHVLEGHYPLPGLGGGDQVAADLWGPHCSNFHVWLRKIKKAFDPNGVSEGSGYVKAEE